MFAPNYFEATLQTTIGQNADGTITPILPCPTQLCLTFVNGMNLFSNTITEQTLVGMNCICHIAAEMQYQSEVQELPGYLGIGNDATTKQPYIDITGSSTPVWEFLEPDYVDS